MLLKSRLGSEGILLKGQPTQCRWRTSGESNPGPFRLAPHLIEHLHTVLPEAVVVVGLAGLPVGEGGHVTVRPRVEAHLQRVVQAGPHVAGGWGGGTEHSEGHRRSIAWQQYKFNKLITFWMLESKTSWQVNPFLTAWHELYGVRLIKYLNNDKRMNCCNNNRYPWIHALL